MKKIWRSVLILLLLFLAAAVGLFFYLGRGGDSKESLYESMPEATLPVLYMTWQDGQVVNPLHGYTQEMEEVYVRDVVVTFDEKRVLSLTAESYGEKILGGDYSIRSLDGSRLIEDSSFEVSAEGEKLPISLQLSALLENDSEYRMDLRLQTQKHPEIHYYFRITGSTDRHLEELLGFAAEFSASTYDKTAAREKVVPYLAPNDTQTNDSFSYANLHSSFATITWGDMQMQCITEPVLRIYEMTKTQLSASMEYRIQGADEDGVLRQYEVTEFFCIRLRDGKIYLLDYERRTTQVFRGKQNEVQGGNLWLGITDGSDVQALSNESGDCTVLNYNGELWAYNAARNEMLQIFSFREEQPDMRNDYDQHGISLMQIDSEQNIYFMVYGYMNRGLHEGQTGVCFYRYDHGNNRIQELYYIPSDASYQILKESISSFAYVNEDNLCYFLYDNVIYSIDLVGKESQKIAVNVNPASFSISSDGSVIMWQTGSQEELESTISLLDMRTGKLNTLSAKDGEYLEAVGFLQNDLVYGRGRREEIVTEAGVEILFPLYSVEIMETEEMTVDAVYSFRDIYVTEVAIERDRIRLERVHRSEDGSFTPIEEDILILNDAVKSPVSELHSVQSSLSRRIYYVTLGDGSKKNFHFSTVRPAFEKRSDVTVIDVDRKEPALDSSYYVYASGEVLGIHRELRKAIEQAYDSMGVVITGEWELCWNRDSRLLEVEIPLPAMEPSENSLSAAVRLLLANDGASVRDCEQLLASGLSPVEVFREAVGKRAVDLYGCTLSQVLYYLNQKRPVLAVLSDTEAYVLTGYTTGTIRMYDPAGGEAMEWNMQQAEQFFAGEGNRFAAIVP